MVAPTKKILYGWSKTVEHIIYVEA